MYERMILTVVICSVGLLAFAALQMVQRRRLSQVTAHIATPSILYFRSDTCAACSTQKRFLDELQTVNPVEVSTIDVMQEPEAAAQYNIMTLPTTVIVNGDGEVKQINYGVVNADKLVRQMEL